MYMCVRLNAIVLNVRTLSVLYLLTGVIKSIKKDTLNLSKINNMSIIISVSILLGTKANQQERKKRENNDQNEII